MKFYKSSWLLSIAALFVSGTKSHSNDNNLSAYEVRLTYDGYVTFFVDPPECPVREHGSVVLKGILSANENVAPYDDIRYTGTLQLDIDLDICSVTHGDPPKYCDIGVKGSGLVKTVLEISYDGRGAYIQTPDTTKSGFSKNISGSCESAEMIEERGMIPLQTKANVFNGKDLPMLKDRTLKVGWYVDHEEAGATAIEVLRKIN